MAVGGLALVDAAVGGGGPAEDDDVTQALPVGGGGGIWRAKVRTDPGQHQGPHEEGVIRGHRVERPVTLMASNVDHQLSDGQT